MSKGESTLRKLYWILFIILLTLPVVITLCFVSDMLSFVVTVFLYWHYWETGAFFKDVTFLEGSVFLVFGAIVCGVTLHNFWVPKDMEKVNSTENVWNWRQLRRRDIPTRLKVGLTLTVFGVIYILTAVLFPNFSAPVL